MSVDPILPLSISITEGERTYAIFLGSGISSNAGIPTGGQLLSNTIKLLYKMENNGSEVRDEEVEVWFKKSEYKSWGYSEILEELCPSKEDRRNFLEKIFLGKTPTDSHHIIAEMVEQKLVKVIVTTNFDRLMEQALDEKGVAYDVVSSEKDISELKPREHSNCRIIKLHGDYQKFNIKNTKKELESLEDGVADEFKDILNNYGIVVIGYGGSDKGVMDCMEERTNPRYTLYWVAQENVNIKVEDLIKLQNGKKIVRRSADEFFLELFQKIDIYRTYPSGETPEFVIQEVINYLRLNDYIGLNEVLKKQKKNIEKKYYEITQKVDKLYKSHEDFEPHSDGFKVQPLFEEPKINNSLKIPITGYIEFEKYVDILTAMGLILIEYDDNNYFNTLLKTLNEIYDLIPIHGADLKVSNISKAAVHNIYYQWGAYALKKDNFMVLKQLINYKIINYFSFPEIKSKEIWRLLSGDNIASFDEDPNKIFNYLKNSYIQKEFLKEFFKDDIDYLRNLYQFNFILCLYSVKTLDRVGINPHSSKLSGYDMRIFIEPFLLKIKTDFNFNYSISEVLDDLNDNGNDQQPLFISNFPYRCGKINSFRRDEWNFDDVDCTYFNK